MQNTRSVLQLTNIINVNIWSMLFYKINIIDFNSNISQMSCWDYPPFSNLRRKKEEKVKRDTRELRQKEQQAAALVRIAFWPYLKLFATNAMIWPLFGLFSMLKEIVLFWKYLSKTLNILLYYYFNSCYFN